MKKMVIYSIILLVWLSGCQADQLPDGYQRFEPEGDSITKITFLYPEGWELERVEYLPMERVGYAMRNPDYADDDPDKYRGIFAIWVEADPSGDGLSRSIEMSHLAVSHGGFELLKEETIPYDNFTLFWFQYLIEPSIYQMPMQSIENNVTFRIDGWTYDIGYSYPAEDKDGSFAQGFQLFLDTLEVVE